MPQRNMAMAATMAIASAHGSTLAKLGTLKSSPKPLIGSVSVNIVRVPNLIAKVRTTPRTPPVTALNVVLMCWLLRNLSMNGPTREIHKNVGMEMTHTLSSPPNVAAASGGSMP
jgi:hypothetical protein